jgi:hypothetical protein
MFHHFPSMTTLFTVHPWPCKAGCYKLFNESTLTYNSKSIEQLA